MRPRKRTASFRPCEPEAHTRLFPGPACGLVLGLLCGLVPLPGHGQAVAAAAPFNATAFAAQDAVAPAALDGYRGGFVSPSGLAVTLGIERIVTQNGNVLAHSALQFGELGRLTAGRVPQEEAGALQLAAGMLGGVLQNSLDNQLIGQTIIINASVDARGALQSMHFQSTLSQALTGALAGK
jgi:hypothetical protein